MIELGKVIKGLECCIKRDPDDKARCDECPYDGACLNRLKIDALALLKAQEQNEDAQRYYEAAVEMAEYCERYEPTYNPDDGSM